ncbi:uncharacterized protein LOC125251966 [Megalobrama amblycephala]|uniref:uncharacterized protein LOC125251966 n=1 Tax=Megalobrama amblycephala TaxID=75352 RepID=UPI0020142AC3|nr:uncharacterized protein LOC125251966 [Megalobrama amblycephala]
MHMRGPKCASLKKAEPTANLITTKTATQKTCTEGDDPPPDCCLTVTDTRVPAEKIVSYTIQEPPICPLRSVRFHTKKDIIICSDPESNWAMNVMKVVDGRTTTNPTACSTYTTTMFPTTTHKTPGPETETSESPTDDHPDCCLTVTNTRVPVENIEDYHIQEQTGVCTLRAVRFLTKKGKYICLDPDDRWAKRAMEIVNRRRTPTEEPSKEPVVYDQGCKEYLKTILEYSFSTPLCPVVSNQISLRPFSTEESLTIRREQRDKMKSSLFSAILFCIGWMSVVVTGDDRPPDCCLTVTNTRVPVKNIEDYEIQESTGVCAVRAVRFITRKGINICSDPDDSWAIRAINEVNCRKNKEPCVKSTTCFTSTTNMIPTTTHKTPVTETETSTSTTASTKVTTIETSGPKTETSTTTTQQTSVSKEKPKSPSSNAKTCGTGGPAAPPIKTTRETPGKGTVIHQTTSSRTTNTETTSTKTTTSPPKRTKLSPLLIKKRRKSKKQLHKYQNKSG